MTRFALLVALITVLPACASVDQTRLPDGRSVYKIACGAAAPWSICLDQAAAVCPNGYEQLSMEAGFNRKEMKIICDQAQQASASYRP